MPKRDKISDEEMIAVIADFLEQGLVANIVSMFKVDTSYYGLVGDILKDERYAVRIGISVLFEELKEARPQDVALALPALIPLLDQSTPAYVRGEAVSVLGLIGGVKALDLLRPLVDDEDIQVAEIAKDFLDV